jgi:hypothetical protein
MSPTSTTSFKFLIAQFQGEITRCVEYCEDIRRNRKLEGTTNLSNLQNALESAEMSIPTNFSTFRIIAGPQMESGDDRARREMDQHILDIQFQIKAHLRTIAAPRREKHELQHAGFKDMLFDWEDINRRVSNTMRNLSIRIADTPVPATKPAEKKPAEKKPEPKKKNTDDVTITMKEFDHMLEHLKNSWEEIVIGGSVVYQNAFDKRRIVRDRPDGWIKTLPRATRTRTKVPSWERRDDY